MKLHLLMLVLMTALLPLPATSANQPWQAVGSGDMRWTFFKLYHITLQTPDGQYEPGKAPLALEIRYYRDIDNRHLVEATADQWQKLGLSPSRYERWLDSLSRLWPDVAEGDTLRLEVDDSGASRFFHNDRLLGSVDDPAFGAAFTDIWLSPNTSRPELRQRLIGDRNSKV